MPKLKSTVGSRLRSFVIASEKKFTIQQHISRDKHARGIQRKLNEVKQNNQVLLSNLTNNCDQSSFNLELKNISAILDGENTTSRDGIPEDLTFNDMVHFKYAPAVTSVDVERGFFYIKTFYLTAVATSCLKTLGII
ncbi:uncharacterized protein LOC107883909 [Acyrthosiphon pisum]|uniref:Uncharacterized protein n=1 Tax=Acyrthosiphon pisum TaxID=7029 RepID=A0A8R2JL41_ACYPI|nr:uncharacterized protein LOC107883909 [Acyrthosiphon pisum]